MNCYYCKSACKFLDQSGKVQAWFCDNHPLQVNHLCVENNKLVCLEMNLPLPLIHDKLLRVSWDLEYSNWAIHEVYGWKWNSAYSDIYVSESPFVFTPENVKDKVKLLLNFL
jgi:hypothetical protein